MRPFYHYIIDEFLDKEQAIKISQEFPEYNSNYWFSYNNPLENDGVKSVSYGNIVGLLIEAIKEQQVRIEELERKIDA